MSIRGIYTCVRMECEKSVFQNKASWQLGLATLLSHEFKLWANWMVSLDFLSCSALAGMTVQLLYMLHSCASSGGMPVASHPRDPVTSPCFSAQSWAFLHTLSHTTLTWFPHKYRVSKCWITSKLARNKANKMVDYIQPYRNDLFTWNIILPKIIVHPLGFSYQNIIYWLFMWHIVNKL